MNFSESVKTGCAMDVEFAIDNVGVAPIYRPIPCRLRLINADNSYNFETNVDIRTWMPGKHVEYVSLDLDGVVAGSYKLEIGMNNDHIKEIYFATDAEYDNGYYVVGEIEVI